MRRNYVRITSVGATDHSSPSGMHELSEFNKWKSYVIEQARCASFLMVFAFFVALGVRFGNVCPAAMRRTAQKKTRGDCVELENRHLLPLL